MPDLDTVLANSENYNGEQQCQICCIASNQIRDIDLTILISHIIHKLVVCCYLGHLRRETIGFFGVVRGGIVRFGVWLNIMCLFGLQFRRSSITIP